MDVTLEATLTKASVQERHPRTREAIADVTPLGVEPSGSSDGSAGNGPQPVLDRPSAADG